MEAPSPSRRSPLRAVQTQQQPQELQVGKGVSPLKARSTPSRNGTPRRSPAPEAKEDKLPQDENTGTPSRRLTLPADKDVSPAAAALTNASPLPVTDVENLAAEPHIEGAAQEPCREAPPPAASGTELKPGRPAASVASTPSWWNQSERSLPNCASHVKSVTTPLTGAPSTCAEPSLAGDFSAAPTPLNLSPMPLATPHTSAPATGPAALTAMTTTTPAAGAAAGVTPVPSTEAEGWAFGSPASIAAGSTPGLTPAPQHARATPAPTPSAAPATVALSPPSIVKPASTPAHLAANATGAAPSQGRTPAAALTAAPTPVPGLTPGAAPLHSSTPFQLPAQPPPLNTLGCTSAPPSAAPSPAPTDVVQAVEEGSAAVDDVRQTTSTPGCPARTPGATTTPAATTPARSAAEEAPNEEAGADTAAPAAVLSQATPGITPGAGTPFQLPAQPPPLESLGDMSATPGAAPSSAPGTGAPAPTQASLCDGDDALVAQATTPVLTPGRTSTRKAAAPTPAPAGTPGRPAAAETAPAAVTPSKATPGKTPGASDAAPSGTPERRTPPAAAGGSRTPVPAKATTPAGTPSRSTRATPTPAAASPVVPATIRNATPAAKTTPAGKATATKAALTPQLDAQKQGTPAPEPEPTLAAAVAASPVPQAVAFAEAYSEVVQDLGGGASALKAGASRTPVGSTRRLRRATPEPAPGAGGAADAGTPAAAAALAAVDEAPEEEGREATAAVTTTPLGTSVPAAAAVSNPTPAAAPAVATTIPKGLTANTSRAPTPRKSVAREEVIDQLRMTPTKDVPTPGPGTAAEAQPSAGGQPGTASKGPAPPPSAPRSLRSRPPTPASMVPKSATRQPAPSPAPARAAAEGTPVPSPIAAMLASVVSDAVRHVAHLGSPDQLQEVQQQLGGGDAQSDTQALIAASPAPADRSLNVEQERQAEQPGADTAGAPAAGDGVDEVKPAEAAKAGEQEEACVGGATADGAAEVGGVQESSQTADPPVTSPAQPCAPHTVSKAAGSAGSTSPAAHTQPVSAPDGLAAAGSKGSSPRASLSLSFEPQGPHTSTPGTSQCAVAGQVGAAAAGICSLHPTPSVNHLGGSSRAGAGTSKAAGAAGTPGITGPAAAHGAAASAAASPSFGFAVDPAATAAVHGDGGRQESDSGRTGREEGAEEQEQGQHTAADQHVTPRTAVRQQRLSLAASVIVPRGAQRSEVTTDRTAPAISELQLGTGVKALQSEAYTASSAKPPAPAGQEEVLPAAAGNGVCAAATEEAAQEQPIPQQGTGLQGMPPSSPAPRIAPAVESHTTPGRRVPRTSAVPASPVILSGIKGRAVRVPLTEQPIPGAAPAGAAPPVNVPAEDGTNELPAPSSSTPVASPAPQPDGHKAVTPPAEAPGVNSTDAGGPEMREEEEGEDAEEAVAGPDSTSTGLKVVGTALRPPPQQEADEAAQAEEQQDVEAGTEQPLASGPLQVEGDEEMIAEDTVLAIDPPASQQPGHEQDRDGAEEAAHVAGAEGEGEEQEGEAAAAECPDLTVVGTGLEVPQSEAQPTTGGDQVHDSAPAGDASTAAQQEITPALQVEASQAENKASAGAAKKRATKGAAASSKASASAAQDPAPAATKRGKRSAPAAAEEPAEAAAAAEAPAPDSCVPVLKEAPAAVKQPAAKKSRRQANTTANEGTEAVKGAAVPEQGKKRSRAATAPAHNSEAVAMAVEQQEQQQEAPKQGRAKRQATKEAAAPTESITPAEPAPAAPTTSRTTRRGAAPVVAEPAPATAQQDDQVIQVQAPAAVRAKGLKKGGRAAAAAPDAADHAEAAPPSKQQEAEIPVATVQEDVQQPKKRGRTATAKADTAEPAPPPAAQPARGSRRTATAPVPPAAPQAEQPAAEEMAVEVAVPTRGRTGRTKVEEAVAEQAVAEEPVVAPTRGHRGRGAAQAAGQTLAAAAPAVTGAAQPAPAAPKGKRGKAEASKADVEPPPAAAAAEVAEAPPPARRTRTTAQASNQDTEPAAPAPAAKAATRGKAAGRAAAAEAPAVVSEDVQSGRSSKRVKAAPAAEVPTTQEVKEAAGRRTRGSSRH